MFYNSIHTAVLIIEFILLIIFIGKASSILEVLPILISIAFLSCFFTIYGLFIYYMLHPYTKDLEVKSPVFKGVNLVVFVLCYGCRNIKFPPENFTISIISVTMIIIALSLWMVKRYAPKTFKLK